MFKKISRGGEDDDVNKRSKKKFGKVARNSPELGRYFANCHQEEQKNPTRLINFL